MNITKFSQVCIKAFIIFTGVASLLSCKDDNPETVEENNFLGSPAASQINLRFIPKNWLDKHLFDSSKVKTPQRDDLLTNFLDESPALANLGNNFFKLEPDLSKNWILSAGIFKETKFISLYLKIGQAKLIDGLINSKSIKSHQKIGSINCFQVDDKLIKHNYILYDQEHLAIIKLYGSEEESNAFLHQCVYPNKESYLSYFDTLFSEYRNDIDIRIEGNEKIAQLINEPILKAMASNFDGILSINLAENKINLAVENFQKDFVLDTLFKSFSPIDEKLVSIQTNLNLNAWSNFLTHFGYLEEVNYELNKLNLNLSKLQELMNGEFCLSYKGKKIENEKIITYEYDDDFNQQEKITYKTSSSHDFCGKVGSNYPKNLLSFLVEKQWIIKTKEGKFEPIAGSKSHLHLENNYLKIGKPELNHAIQLKFLFSISKPTEILEIINQESWLNVFPFASATLKIDTKNTVNLEISTIGENYNYIHKVLQVINPESFNQLKQ